MRRLSVLPSLLMACLYVTGPVANAPAELADRPNIVFFFIDDMGWADVGFMGSKFYESPNIDRLAGQGMVFTDAYANAPNCRASTSISPVANGAVPAAVDTTARTSTRTWSPANVAST